MIGTRRTFLFGCIAAPFALPTSAKRRRNRRRGKHKRRHTPAPPPQHDAILRDLAERMVFGVRDEGVSLDDLEAALARGNVIEALCGTQAHLATRSLRGQGMTTRRVGALRDPYGPDNSHVMLEVRVSGAWHCYDIMSNTKVANSLSVVAWCADPTHAWQRIATDPNWPHTDAEIAGIYKLVLKTPWIEDERGYAVFHDPANAEAIVAARPWLVPVDRPTWDALLA